MYLTNLLAIALTLATPQAATSTTSQSETGQILKAQSQELLDAVTYGKPEVWDRYLDEHTVITTEDGKVHTKAEMVKDIKPLPEGVSGTLIVTEFKAVDHGAVAVTNYVADEHENYHGHPLHCGYLETDTWLKTAKGWRLIGSEILALRTDPPAIQLKDSLIDTYVGRYALTPTITYEIRRSEGKLEGRRSGRDWEVLKAESPDVLFVPGDPRYRKVFQRDAEGRITGFADRREAWDLIWAKAQ
jgi:hypothetical protein